MALTSRRVRGLCLRALHARRTQLNNLVRTHPPEAYHPAASGGNRTDAAQLSTASKPAAPVEPARA